MSSALTPLNQLKALPLYSTQSGAGSGIVTVTPNGIVKEWTGTDLGLASAGSPGHWVNDGTVPSPQWNDKSSLLDFRGVVRFSLVCTFTNNTGAAASSGYGVYLVQALSSLQPPIINGDKGNMVRVGNIGGTSIPNGASLTRQLEFTAHGIQFSGPGSGVSGNNGLAGQFWQIVLNSINPGNTVTGGGMSVFAELWGES